MIKAEKSKNGLKIKSRSGGSLGGNWSPWKKLNLLQAFKISIIGEVEKMKFFAGLVLTVVSFCALATPGGVDYLGCHNSKVAGHHCHGLKVESIPANMPGENQKSRSARLRAQCRGLENRLACFGYVY